MKQRRALTADKNDITYGVNGIACAQSDKIGVNAANGRQKKNANKLHGGGDKKEEKGLLFKAHGIERAGRNHGQGKGNEQRTACLNKLACLRIAKGDKPQVLAEYEK